MKKVTCSACRFYMKELNRCGYHGASCHNADGERWCDKFKKPTVFDKITESHEVLAEKLVYKRIDSYYCSSGSVVRWTSTISDWEYDTKEEAIAATVAKLKEVDG